MEKEYLVIEFEERYVQHCKSEAEMKEYVGTLSEEGKYNSEDVGVYDLETKEMVAVAIRHSVEFI